MTRNPEFADEVEVWLSETQKIARMQPATSTVANNPRRRFWTETIAMNHTAKWWRPQSFSPITLPCLAIWPWHWLPRSCSWWLLSRSLFRWKISLPLNENWKYLLSVFWGDIFNRRHHVFVFCYLTSLHSKIWGHLLPILESDGAIRWTMRRRKGRIVSYCNLQLLFAVWVESIWPSWRDPYTVDTLMHMGVGEILLRRF